MKNLILILGIAMVALTSCKKEVIKPNKKPYIENTIEDTIVTPHISDSMSFVSIKVKSLQVTVGLNVNNDGIDYPVYSHSVDSSIYVSNGWNTSHTYPGSSRSATIWIKPGSVVVLSGSFTGGGNNVFNFEVTIQINNGTPIKKYFSITTSNKNYSTAFYVN